MGKLALRIDFDLVRDLVVDLMHLCMVLIKDLAYVTAGIIEQVLLTPTAVNTGYDINCR